MRKTLIVACLLATTAVMPALAAGEMSKKLTAETYTDLQTTISQYVESTTVDTETFEDGAVVNITPLLDQINGAFTGHEYTSEDRDASNKKRPAYVTEDQFKEIAKTLDSQLKGFSGGGSVNVGLVRQAVTTTLTQAQASTQMSNATEVRASERAAIKAYVAAMKASGQTLKMSAGGALAWGPSHGYPIVAPKYYTPAQLSARFTGTAKTTTSGGTGSTGTGSTGTGSTGTGNTGTGSTGTGNTGTGNTGTVGTGTGSTGTVGTGGTGTGTGSTGTVGSGSSGTVTPGMGTGTGSTGTGVGTGSAGTGTGSTGAGTTQGGTLVLPNPTDLGTAIGNTGGSGTGTTGTSTGGSTGAPVTTGMSSNGTSTNTPDGAVPGGLTTDPSLTTTNNTPTNVTTVVQPQPTPATTNQTPIDPTLNPTLVNPGQELGANDVPRNIGQSVGSALNSAAAALQ